MICESRDPNVVLLLEQLVEINSANPATYVGGPGEREIAAFCHNWLRLQGVSCETILADNDEERPSIVATSFGNKAGRHLVLVGHLDTYLWYKAQSSTSSSGVVYGPGAYDMKAGIAIIMATMATLAQKGHCGVVTAFLLADEEHRSLGLHAIKSHLKAESAIVLEGTGLQLGLRHDGRVRITIDFETPAERKALMLQLANRARCNSSLRDGVQFAIIDNGVWRVVLQRKLSAGEDAQKISERILGEVFALDSPQPYVDVRPAFITQEPCPIVEVVRQKALEHGITALSVVIPGWTEAAFIAGYGIPTLVFGPGGGGAHTCNEWVDKAQTEQGASILLDSALKYCELP